MRLELAPFRAMISTCLTWQDDDKGWYDIRQVMDLFLRQPLWTSPWYARSPFSHCCCHCCYFVAYTCCEPQRLLFYRPILFT